MDFMKFKNAVAKRFQEMQQHKADMDLDELKKLVAAM